MTAMNRRNVLQAIGTTVAGTALASWSAQASEKKPTSPPRIKVGQIGVAHAHANKLGVYRQSPEYEVVGIVERDEELRRRVENTEVYRGLPWMTQEQLLNVPGLQAVLVETAVRDSLNAAEACIAAGKHIHLDKPAGESLPHFQRILQSASRQKLLVQMGYMFRYNPAIVMLRNVLQQGWLGEPFEVHTVMSKVVPPADRKKLAEYPGGIMFELGCHVIDLVVSLLGPPDQITPFRKRTAVNSDDGLMDNMLAVFDYPRATATVKSSAVEVNGFDRRHLVICGTEGTFHIQPLDNPSARVALSQSRGELRAGYQEVKFPKYTRYVDDAADMARILRGEKASDFSYEHDLAVQKGVLQASGVAG